jgi:hypothetical protein
MAEEESEGKKIFQEALLYMSVNVAGSLLPIILGILIVMADTGQWSGIHRFIKNGEVFIICISILISSCYTFFKNKTRTKGFNLYTSLFLLSGLVLLISLTIFSVGTARYILHTSISSFNYPFIKYSSLGLVVLTSFSSFYAQINEYSTNDADARGMREEALQDLRDKFKNRMK